MSEWRLRAACRDRNSDDFISDTPTLTAANRRALATCAACPVRMDCDAEYQDETPRRLRVCTIAGGRVYDSEGIERKYFRRVVVAPRTDAPSGPCEAPGCTVKILNRISKAGVRKYCSTRCSKRAQYWRDRDRKVAAIIAAGVPTCASPDCDNPLPIDRIRRSSAKYCSNDCQHAEEYRRARAARLVEVTA